MKYTEYIIEEKNKSYFYSTLHFSMILCNLAEKLLAEKEEVD